MQQSLATIDEYRRAATGTLAYVESHLFFGAYNRVGTYVDAMMKGGAAPVWLGAMMASHVFSQAAIKGASTGKGRAAQAAGRPYLRGSRRLTRAMMDIWAEQGLRFHCGNCGVQSAVAFTRLRDFWKIFPLDWMQEKDGDHGFVVVGREAGTDPSSPSVWNAEAIICDPWRGVVHQARTYTGAQGKLLEVMYRQESVDDVPED